MSIASGELGLALLLIVLIPLSALWRQVLALPVLLIGVGLFCFLGITILFNIGRPYDMTGIGIYVVFFLAVIFTMAGGTGLLIRALSRR